MDIVTLRPYQKSAIAAILEAFERHRSTLLIMPTGTGKTITFAEVVRVFVEHGERVLILAHRGELLAQAMQTLMERAGITQIGIEKGKERASGEPVVVASMQSLRGKRLQTFSPGEFGLIVCDEAHHSVSKGFSKILDYFSAAKVLGVTATPDRLDGKPLSRHFDCVAYEYGIQAAINDEYLCKIVSKGVHVTGLELDTVRTTAGDLNRKDLSKVLQVESNIHNVVYPLIELSGDRLTAVFAADISHSEALCDLLNRYKPNSSRVVSGKTKTRDRKIILGDFSDGIFQYLVSCEILTEGVDIPGIECIAIARPTKSRALYAQMVGRGMRPAEGKEDVLVLDFVGNSGRHTLVSTMDVLAGAMLDDRRVVQRARELGVEDVEIDDLEALNMAISLLRKEDEEEAENQKVRAVAEFFVIQVNPFLQLTQDDVIKIYTDPYHGVDNRLITDDGMITDETEWGSGGLTLWPARDPRVPVDDFTRSKIEGFGFVCPVELMQCSADRILKQLSLRKLRGLCSYKQYRFLIRNKIDGDLPNMTSGNAGHIISKMMGGFRAKRKSG